MSVKYLWILPCAGIGKLSFFLFINDCYLSVYLNTKSMSFLITLKHFTIISLINIFLISYLAKSMESHTNSSYDFVIVGGGVYGVCIAYYLSKLNKYKVLLLEQFQIGHTHGSSHSPTRITRSTY
jgi:hypothetical protein